MFFMVLWVEGQWRLMDVKKGLLNLNLGIVPS